MGFDTIFLDSTVIGQQFEFTVNDTANDVMCWGDILFVDGSVPYPNCSSDTISCFQSTEPDSLGFPTPSDTNVIITSIGNNCYNVAGWDNCGDVGLCYKDVNENLSCHPTICQRIFRTWTITDSRVLPNSPSTTSCVDTINILLPDRSFFQAPVDITQPDNEISCADLNNNGILDLVEDLWPPFSGNGIPDINEDELFGIAQANSPFVLAGQTKAGIPFPLVTGSPVMMECYACVLYDWKDQIIDSICGRNEERTWKIRGWCSNQDNRY